MANGLKKQYRPRNNTLQAYRRRLRAFVELAPAWLAEEILSASQRIGDDRPAVWLREMGY